MIEYNVDGEKLICKFLKRMDTDACMECEEKLFEKIEELKKAVVFNLKEVDYVSSLFLSICMRASKTVGTGNLLLINLHPNVKKVFKISGLDTQFTIE